MKIYINDIRKQGYCVNGIKDFCKLHGINFRDFIKNGIQEEDVAGIDDAMLQRILAGLKLNGGE